MSQSWLRAKLALIVALLLGVSGCSSIELEEVNPIGVDLSGAWQLDMGASDEVPDLRNHRSKSDQRRVQRAGRRGIPADFVLGGGSGLSFIRQDFQVLSAKRLEIEQNRDSMGVRHRPGVYRDISWGERQRGLWEVRAGWEGRELVVISEASDLRVFERYARDDDRLEVNITVTADDEDFEFLRVFNLTQ
ncbi:MAG: hypothetical protein AAF993_10470 [Pseudomonadota bacterium]